MEILYANIITKDGEYLTEDIMIEDDNFAPLEERAKEAGLPVCIRWHRPTDGQVAYWSPQGAILHPYWYNS